MLSLCHCIVYTDTGRSAACETCIKKDDRAICSKMILMPLPHYNSQNQDDCSNQGKRKQGRLGLGLNRSGRGWLCLGRRTSCISDLERDLCIGVITIIGVTERSDE